MLLSPMARFFIVVFFLGTVGYAGYAGFGMFRTSESVEKVAEYKTPEEADVYVRFAMEAFDSIQKNYWKKASESDLAELLQLSIQRATSSTTPLATKDRAGAAKMLSVAYGAIPEDKKKQAAIDTLIVALYNLPPVGRAQLLSAKQETELRQDVANVNPEKDLYADVGAPKGATPEEVKEAFEKKKEELEKVDTPEAKQQLAQAAYAADVLTEEQTKARYDTAKVEPTIFTRNIGDTYYLYVERMSPTTFDEFIQAINNVDPKIRNLVIDLRGNIGGALDIAPAWIGLFVGQNSFTFDLFHQEEYEPIRSPIAKLEKLEQFQEVAILTDGMTQSTAEVLTAALKRFNIAKVVGATTRGWGTVENTFPLTTTVDPAEKYTLLLVHSLTLRDGDNQPIESRGVDPDIQISDPAWRTVLVKHFKSTSLIEAIRSLAAKPPSKN
jgi:C-terminal processing protease CtpA/Prc